jgi:hypothetical protein
MLARRPPIGSHRARRSAALVLLLLSAGHVRAQERLVRTFGPEAGLTSTPAWAIAQDSVGFLWIGTEGGLFRFDGTEFRHWAADSIRKPVGNVTVAPDGRIAVLEVNGRAFEVTETGARSITSVIRHRSEPYSLIYDHSGVLWQIEGNVVERRGPDDLWQSLPHEAFEGERIRLLRANVAGAVDVLTDRSLWRIQPAHPPRRILSAILVRDAIPLDDGRTLVLTPDSVIELSAGGRPVQSTRLIVPARSIALIERVARSGSLRTTR